MEHDTYGVKRARRDGFVNRQTCIVFNDPMQNIVTYKCISKKHSNEET